jgi:NTE family protein
MPAAKPKKINLALQGGGALGAYTWGVLDRILEDDRIAIEAISGASAGAMNAVVMAEGLMEGGEAGARKALRQFWEGIAASGPSANPLAEFLSDFTPGWAKPPQGLPLFNPFALWMEWMTKVASPYEFNPLNLNPVRDVLQRLVDFDRVRACDSLQLYISATNVETGRARVFTNAELTPDHVMASACLPLLFQAVEIDGEPYWDGGYMGNPPLFPLFQSPATRDIVIVQINPIERPGAPRSSREIVARMNEITFNSSMLLELRSIEFVGRLLDEGRLEDSRYRKMLMHVISDDAALVPLGAGAGLNTGEDFLEKLFKIGRLACDRWLDENFDALGARSSVDLRRMFQGEIGPIGAAPAGHRRKA